MSDISQAGVVALLLILGCKEEELGDALMYLSGMPFPDSAEHIVKDARWAIQFAQNKENKEKPHGY